MLHKEEESHKNRRNRWRQPNNSSRWRQPNNRQQVAATKQQQQVAAKTTAVGGGGATAGGSTINILEGSSIQGSPDYDPDELTASAGAEVTVVNQDTVLHSATSGTGPRSRVCTAV